MTDPDQINYHSTRAAAELDRGLTTQVLPAARAHLRLASLHFERVRQLARDAGEPITSPLRM
ncbi:hypothetical protein HJG53_09240 [Sphingomonas sp. ID1715]|uniref:hypothetical protein n=1 Tax=Sphingomonas sp. ID1715 TaxID=1656898 RepID=UPI0014895487|nr:hypothetical protein [Sphingomonas sp. ID1715]NNM77084.1 hypothetical protein [Sphingomonas sp. ID1715]